METLYSRQAKKSIENMDEMSRQRVRQAIKGIPQGDIKPLRGIPPGHYRLRVGDLRIIFAYDSENTARIKKIAPRGDAYKGVW